MQLKDMPVPLPILLGPRKPRRVTVRARGSSCTPFETMVLLFCANERAMAELNRDYYEPQLPSLTKYAL